MDSYMLYIWQGYRKALLEFLNWDVALTILSCTTYYLNNTLANLEFGGTSPRTQVEEIPRPQVQLIQDIPMSDLNN